MLSALDSQVFGPRFDAPDGSLYFRSFSFTCVNGLNSLAWFVYEHGKLTTLSCYRWKEKGTMEFELATLRSACACTCTCCCSCKGPGLQACELQYLPPLLLSVR